MTAQQQATLDAALKAYNDALNKEQTAYQTYMSYRTQALDCKAKRDQYSFGPKKNDACHIDTLTTLNAKWAEWEAKYAEALKVTAAAKAAYEKVKAEVYSASEQALATDPNVQITQQTLASQEKIEQQKIAYEAEKSKANQKTIMYVVGGILLLSLIVFLIYRFTR